ncbi:MAG: type II CRISPR RNA-guided endonuclease Cas9 [Pirellulales bacterium]|nr:type II CRISPR RNA-guided endonuclease Cas9 [Pirellulales bacterium]
MKTLGLDLGPNSIGWALIEEHDDPAQSRLIDMGVRVFPEGVDAFDTAKEKSKSEDRRIKRGMRRQTKRRARREKLLARSLVAAGLWPADPAAQDRELAKDPYELRGAALKQPLTPYEIGRVFLHLNRRRGFLSNRKRDAADKEAKGLLEEINQNERERVEGGHPTIGALLLAKRREFDHRRRKTNDHVRRRHLSRRQLVDEFLAVWDAQGAHHPELLSEELKFGALGPVRAVNPRTGEEELSIAPRRSLSRRDPRRQERTDLECFGIFGVMFFQRPLYWPKSVVGLCELEPNRKRCPKSDRAYERFRVLQEINNLRYIDEKDEMPLNEHQRRLALSHLAVKEDVSFDDLRKKLGFAESIKFNLERGSRSKLKGMRIDCQLAKAVGKQWHDRDEAEKTAIVRLLLNDEVDDDRKLVRLRDDFGFTTDEAERALAVDLAPGYGALSRTALEKLLPHLERGLVYQSSSDPEKSALHAAGYLRRDELQRRLFDSLPDFTRLKPADCRLGDIPNPVVKRALVELRKVVNAIIRTYGKPDAVHVELARTVRVGAEKRREMSKLMRDREKLREQAAQEIRQHGVAVRREGILRYLLWQEQGEECLYCGRAISQQQLFGGEADVDHILPYSQSLDDSQANKVVCHRHCNHDKGQRTPHEWLAAARPQDYDRMVQHAGSLMRKGAIPYGKYRRFLQKDAKVDDFIARQLVDTGYIARATVEYLQLLFDQPSRVLGLKGALTAELRWQWGLDTILSELPDSPAWEEDQKNAVPAGEKNRADHRHHAIDAVVVALTNRSRLQQLSRSVKAGGARAHGELLLEPWHDFRDTIARRVRTINVSHRVDRKVSGALHEETLYGPTEQPDEWVVRKPVEALSANEVERIRDKTIRNLVVSRLQAEGIEIGRGKKIDPGKMKAALVDLTMPSGVPIKKVRILKKEQTIQPLRSQGKQQAYVKPGSMHHLCIFEFLEKDKTKREAVFVTMLEAKQRIKNREPLIQRIHPRRPDAKFVMSLSSRELVLADDRLLVFKTAASTSGQMWFVQHTDARRASQQSTASFSATTLNADKVTVDPLGQIRWAND